MKNINEFYSNTEKVMLVDGDLLSYKITSALEETVDWGNDNWTLWSDFKLAKQLWQQSIGFYMGLTKSKNPIICFSDEKNFRKELDSDYKSYRKKIRKPICYSSLKDWIKKTHICVWYKGLEGDDTIGLLATGKYKNNWLEPLGNFAWSRSNDLYMFKGPNDPEPYQDFHPSNKHHYDYMTQVVRPSLGLTDYNNTKQQSVYEKITRLKKQHEDFISFEESIIHDTPHKGYIGF